jgi:hypothetical protein
MMMVNFQQLLETVATDPREEVRALAPTIEQLRDDPRLAVRRKVAGQMLGLSDFQLANAIKCGRLVGHLDGSHLMLTTASIAEYLVQRALGETVSEGRKRSLQNLRHAPRQPARQT